MKQLLILCVGIFMAFAVKAQTPLEFNDNIASITDSLFAKGQMWGTTFNEAYKSKDFVILRPVRLSMQDFIDRNIKSVQNMKDVKKSMPLRLAMIDFLRVERSMCAGFEPIEHFTSTSTPEEIQAALDKLKTDTAKEKTALDKVGTAQNVYAKENGFTIETATE